MVSDVVGNVNANRRVTVKRSIGYGKDASYRQTPKYRVISVEVNIQALSGSDIQRLNNLNIQAVLCACYVFGQFHAIVRQDGKGGDVFQFDDANWLAVQVLENWSHWTKLALQRQTDTTQ
jgi:hypothetical protein